MIKEIRLKKYVRAKETTEMLYENCPLISPVGDPSRSYTNYCAPWMCKENIY